MTKKITLPFLIVLLASMLTGCTTHKYKLTYGTYISQNLNSLKELDNNSLLAKVNQDETFLLAVYQGDYSEYCQCWTTFENVVVNYTNKYHEMVYLFNAQKQDETISNLRIAKIEASTPSLYVFNGEKQIASFSYDKKQDKSIFSDINGDAMYTRVHRNVFKPSLYFVDENYVQTNLKQEKEALLLFIRESCGDCTYVLPNMLIPYINERDINNQIWIYDLEDSFRLANKENATEEEKKQYQDLKNQYGLSETANKIYGYLNGVVPTFQHYYKGILDDSCVVFNDVISIKENGNYYISESFYSNERLTSLIYCNNALKGRIIDASEIAFTKSGNPYWIQEKAALVHAPLLEAFLNIYCK